MMSIPENPLARNRLRYNVLLETLTDAEFDALVPLLREHTFAPGAIIVENDSYGGEVFFLVDGRVRIAKPVTGDEQQLLALLHPGDCFGELEAISGRPRSALVIAEDACLIYALSVKDFETLLRKSPEVSVRLLQVLSTRLRASNDHFVAEIGRRLSASRIEVHALHQLIDAAKSLNSTLDLDALLDVILETALHVVDGDRGSVYIFNEARTEIWTKVASGLDGDGAKTITLPLGKGIAGYVAATGDTINIPEAYHDPRFNPEFDRVTGYRTRSILCVPMRDRDKRIVGVFQLLNKKDGVFTDADAMMLDALSVHAAIAIENARLVLQEKEKIRIERDLMAAREVQISLLPPGPPEVPGYEFIPITVPAREVGGDLYDFIRLDQHRVVITVGDVSGKGLPAALLMAHIQASVRNVAHEAMTASACTTLLNDRLVQSTSPEKFVTLVYAVLDTRTHSVRYTNGGHNPPIYAGADGVRPLTAGGTLLGIVEGMAFEEEVVALSPGDTVVFYTDGISEAVNPRQELFGDERLQKFVEERRGHSVEMLKNEILNAVREHQQTAPQADDMTLVIIRRLPVQ
jgi:phosphoserine phosphatase RsbU/P